jgi:hypothetical protein
MAKARNVNGRGKTAENELPAKKSCISNIS